MDDLLAVAAAQGHLAGCPTAGPFRPSHFCVTAHGSASRGPISGRGPCRAPSLPCAVGVCVPFICSLGTLRPPDLVHRMQA